MQIDTFKSTSLSGIVGSHNLLRVAQNSSERVVVVTVFVGLVRVWCKTHCAHENAFEIFERITVTVVGVL